MTKKIYRSKITKMLLFVLLALLALMVFFAFSPKSKITAHAYSFSGSYTNYSGGHNNGQTSTFSTINSVGSTGLASGCTRGQKWAYNQSSGADSDITSNDNNIRIDQGTSTGTRYALAFTTIQLHSSVTAAIAAGKVKMTFTSQVCTAGKGKTFSVFIAWGSGNIGIDGFTNTASAKSGDSTSESYVSQSATLTGAYSNVTAVRVGVQVKKEGIGRHMEVYAHQMVLERWVTGTVITPHSQSKTYDGNIAPLQWTATPGILAGNTFTPSWSGAGATAVNVGTHTLTLGGTVDGGSYYTYSFGSSTTVTINRRPVTATAAARSKTYGEADPSLDYSITSGSLVSGESLVGFLSRVSGEIVGTYAIERNTLINANNPNYDIAYVGANLTINKKPFTVTIQSKTITYGDTDVTLTVTPTVPSDTWAASSGSWATINASSLTRTGDRNAGTYTISKGASFDTNNSNYNLTVVGDGTATYTINQRGVTISAPTMSREYWSTKKAYETYTPTITYNPSSFNPAGAGAGIVAVSGTLNRNDGEDVAIYTINRGSYTDAANPNYSITFNSATYTITQFPIQVQPKANQSKVYGQGDPSFTYENLVYPTGGGAGYATLTGALARTGGNDVGFYNYGLGTFEAAGANPNYSITLMDNSGSIKFEIVKKDIEITVQGVNVTYDPTKTEANYQAMLGVVTPAAGVLEYSETLSVLNITLSKALGLSAATYAITPGYSSGNYNVTFVNANFVISKATRTINTSAMATTATYSGLTQTIAGATRSVDELPEFTDTEISYNGTNSFKDVPLGGTLEISMTLPASTNYLATSTTHTVTISKYAVTVTIADKESVYKTTPQPLTWTHTNLVNGEPNSNLGVSLYTGVTINTEVGTYQITGSYNSQNYLVTFSGTYSGGTSGTYSVTQAQSVITGGLGSYVYSGLQQTISGYVLNNEEATITYGNNTFTNVPVGGSLTITYYVAATKNYKGISTTSVDVPIAKAATEIKTNGVNLSYTYDGYMQTVSGATIEQIATPEVPVATIKYSNNTFTNVGTGSQTVTIYTDATQNYLAGNTTVDITISPAALSASINNASKTYGQGDPSFTFVVNSGLKGSDTAEGLGISLERVNTSNAVGTYDITKASQTNGNYAVTISTGTLTINAKAIQVQIKDQESVYRKSEKVLTVPKTGSNPEAVDEVNLTGQLVYTDTMGDLKIVLTRQGLSVVGEYPIEGSQGSGASGNYIVSFVGSYTGGTKGTYTITQAQRVINTNSVGRNYVYSGQQQTISGAFLDENNLDVGESQDIINVSNNTFTDVPQSHNQTVTFSVSETANFKAVTETVTVSIIPYHIKVNILDAESEYGQEPVVLDSDYWSLDESTPMLTGQLVSILGVSLNAPLVSSSSAIGSYPISGSWNNTLTNYTLQFLGTYQGGINGTYRITQATTIITIDIGEYTYNGFSQTVTGITANHSERTLEIGNNTFIDVPNSGGVPGRLDITYRMDASTNYKAVPLTTVSVFINRKPTTLDTSSMIKEYTYNGNTRTITGASNGHTGNHVASIQYENNSFRNVPADGYLDVIITSPANNNYLAATTTERITIKKAKTTLVIEDKSAYYGEDTKPLTAVLASGSSLQGGDKIEYLGLTLKKGVGTDVGTYDISCTGYTNGNYDITFNGSYGTGEEGKGKYIVTAKNISVTIANKESAYLATPEPLTWSLSVGSTMAYSESGSLLDIILTKQGENYVGEYSITGAQGESASENYNVSFVDGIYKITRITRTIDTSGMVLDRTYSGVEQVVEGAALSVVDPTGDPVIEYSNNRFTNVPESGTQRVDINVAASRNYEAVSTFRIINISKYQTTVTVANKTSEYKSETVPLTATFDSLAAGQNISVLNLNLSTEASNLKNAGEYVITATYSNSNYNVTINEGVYTITKVAVGLIADTKTVTYGSMQSLTFTLSGSLKAGDNIADLNVVLQRNPGQNVGTYPITLKSYDDTNYTFSYTGANYNIVAKPISVLIESKQTTYGKGIAPLTFKVSESTPLEYGQAADVLGVKLEKSGGINVGTYQIAGSKLPAGSNNYSLTFSGALGTMGKYEIVKADTEIDVTSILKVYTFTNETQSVTGDASLILKQTGDYINTLEYSNNTFKDVPVDGMGQSYGTQEVTVSVSGNHNYNPKAVSFVITINKAATTITANITDEYTYDGETQTVVGTVTTNQVGAYQSAITYINNTFKDVPVAEAGATFGTQTMTIQVWESRNYLPQTKNVTIKIYKATATIDTSQMLESYTYNTTQQEILGATLSHGETTITYSNNTFTNVPTDGYLNVVMNAVSTRNYLATSATKQITINKAKQIINVSEVKREYKKLVDTLPVTVDSGASVPDVAQVIKYENNVFYAWDGEGGLDGASVKIYVEATQNYLYSESFVILLVDKIASVIDISGVLKNYVYTGSTITIDTGAVLTVGDEENQLIQWENNEFTTVAEGNALEVRVFVAAYGDYSAAEVRFSINVEKANSILSLDQSALDFVYTGSLQTVKPVSLTNHSCREVEYENNTFTTVAEGTALRIKAYVSESENYKAAAIENIRINVEKADTNIDLQYMTKDFVYTGLLQQAVGATMNHSQAPLQYINNTFVTVADGNGKRAEVIVPESANYKGAAAFVILNVQKATYNMVGVSLANKIVDYNAMQHSLTISGILPNGVTVTYSTSKQINAGTYDVIATFNGDFANYNQIENMSATLKINKVDYNFAGISFESKEKVYNGKYQSLEITGNLPIGLDNSRPNVIYSGQRKVVGTTAIVASFSTSSVNYKIPEGLAIMNANLTIKPLEIIVATGQIRVSVPVENLASFTLTESNYKIANKALGDTVNITYTSELIEDEDGPVGKAFAKMTILSVDNENYALPSNPEFYIDAAIKYPIDISVGAHYLEYDGTEKQFDVTAKINNIDVPYSVMFEQGHRQYNSAIDAGVYTMIITVVDEYAGRKVVEEPMQINRIDTTLSIAGRFTQTYGTFELFTASLETPYEFNEAASLEITYSFSTAIPEAGNHTVTAYFAGSKNYEEKTIIKPFIVEKKKITLKISENNEYVYNGERQNIRYSLSSFAAADRNIVTLNYGENNPSSIGEYSVNVTLNNPNYILENVVGPLEMSIVKAPLEIFVGYVYGIEDKEIDFNFEYIGFVPGEGAEDLDKLPTISKKVYKAGNYEIKASGAESENYDISYIPFELEVYRKNLTLKTKGEEVTITGMYGGNSSVKVEEVTGDVFFNEFFRLTNSVTAAYRVEVVGEQNTEIDNTPRKVLIKNNNIKINPFVGAYFIDAQGNKIKLSKQDISNGYVETTFDADRGFIVVYQNHLLWIILGLSVLLIVVITILTKALTRKRGSRLASKYRWLS